MAGSASASNHRPRENWSSRLGVILAVSGSAVGLGNFLRFPGQAAQYGGGAFMIAYVISFLLIGLPICWSEWAMGRYAGQRGYNSCPGIFNFVGRHRFAKYAGVIGVIIPVVIYMYYVYIEAWCLGYAVNFLRGTMKFADAEAAGAYWKDFIGFHRDGEALGFGLEKVGPYLILVFVLNFVLIYRGLAKGIEWFCKYAMPALIVLALIILVRVLTLGAPDASKPENSVVNGLGFMWNPTKTFVVQDMPDGTKARTEVVDPDKIALAAKNPKFTIETVGVLAQLKNPQLWLAAAGQIFFSLSVGFGIILTYASYLRSRDDVVLSGLSAASANEFCEVGLGGLITIPAGLAFLGVTGVSGQGTFGLGFNVLPMVFSEMPAGNFFGFLFFFLLFLAAVTSSLSMLQPGIAFIEEAMNLGRKMSVALLGFITAVGCGFVVYFSKDIRALDTLDFWVGTFLIFILATIQVILFSWVMGVDRGFEEAHKGAAIRVPGIFRFILKYVSPLFLLIVFVMWLLVNVFGVSFETGQSKLSGYVVDLFVEPQVVSWMSVCLIVLVGAMVTLILSRATIYRSELANSDGE
ncbi:MAG: sodium:calcium symporter [Verrucomicrobiae bacterium]|nr:sodium:calcium symporter [Verrucomicrobiae bacterium]